MIISKEEENTWSEVINKIATIDKNAAEKLRKEVPLLKSFKVARCICEAFFWQELGERKYWLDIHNKYKSKYGSCSEGN